MTRKKLSETLKRRIACSQKYKCSDCKDELPWTWELDHIVPHSIMIQLGKDPDAEDNLQVMCPNCHAEKTELERQKIIDYKRFLAERSMPSEMKCWHCDTVYSLYYDHQCRSLKSKV